LIVEFQDYTINRQKQGSFQYRGNEIQMKYSS
jgi:hypothetical protein